MAKIKAVLFDFGGVFTVSPFTAFEDMGEGLGARPGQVNEIMFGPYGIDGDHPWHRLERGEITLEQARIDILEIGQRDFGLTLDIYELLAKIPRDGGLKHQLVERVAGLKSEGYTTGIITNNVKEFSDGWRSLLPVDDLFDLVIDSSFEGVRKPNVDIFHLTLERLGGLDASDTIFLDDHEANIAAANTIGMQTVLVDENIEQAICDLNDLLNKTQQA